MALSPQIKLILGVVFGFVLISAAYGVPVASSDSQSSQTLADQITVLQQQLTEIQNVIGQQQQAQQAQQQQPNQIEQKTLQSAPNQQNSQFMQVRPLRSAAWQPMKRLVAWQPMKRSGEPIINQDLQRDQLIRAIESQLSDVLHAGETLGISAEDVLTHLRQRSDVNFS
uniref:Signal peptide protein n=1 Tax=Panagrolaimus sp. JU765 TaxID=591449 RepID=A0AC34RC89_9BILA